MTDNTTPKRPRRMARQPAAETNQSAAEPKQPEAKGPSRLDQLEQLLTRDNGASIAEMIEVTGWQQHSVRGALAGALKKRGLAIASEKVDGTRRYRATRAAA